MNLQRQLRKYIIPNVQAKENYKSMLKKGTQCEIWGAHTDVNKDPTPVESSEARLIFSDI
jgi:hypothetical protein